MVIRMNKHSLFTSNSKNSGRRKGGAIIFFLKLFCVFLALCLFFGKVIMPQYLYNYNAALLDKMERLKTLESPKIVLIGNSNVAFGIRSEMLEDAFHMPVVNMGLHGGLGNVFHEEMAKVNVQEGDIIIVAHTDFADDDSLSDPVLTWLAVENHADLWKLIRVKNLPDMFLAYPSYAKKAIALWVSGKGNEPDYGTAYDRTAFNEYGDIAFPRPATLLEEDYFTKGALLVPNINDICTKRLNALNQYITERGAVLLIAAYPIPSGEGAPCAEDYLPFQEELSRRLDCPVISDYTDYLFDYSLFYDTVGHLTEEGATLRTNQLILDLQHWMEAN